MENFDRFARFYDADYRFYDEDIDLVLELTQQAGGDVLELGCGTGRVLVPVAAAGHRVTGVDSSPALLAIARTKLSEAGLDAQAQLVEQDLRTCDLCMARYYFAYCVSNTLMHLTTPEEQTRVLENAFLHLEPDGLLLLSLFNPDVPRLVAVAGVQEFADRWTDDETGAEVVKWAVRTVDWAEQLQETLFIYEEVFPDCRVQRTLCPFTLRFLWRSEVELMLTQAGFVVEEVWGSFYGDPYEAASENLIVLARRLG
jgi:SAM-dependent methyltransferase